MPVKFGAAIDQSLPDAARGGRPAAQIAHIRIAVQMDEAGQGVFRFKPAACLLAVRADRPVISFSGAQIADCQRLRIPVECPRLGPAAQHNAATPGRSPPRKHNARAQRAILSLRAVQVEKVDRLRAGAFGLSGLIDERPLHGREQRYACALGRSDQFYFHRAFILLAIFREESFGVFQVEKFILKRTSGVIIALGESHVNV